MIGLSNILSINVSDWRRMLQHCVQNIRANFKEGKMQDGKSGLQYKSEQYKKYKANAMEQLKYGRSLFNPETGQLMRGNKLKTKTTKSKDVYGNLRFTSQTQKGGRLWNYAAKSVESRRIDFVDMTLSGDLKKGLHVVEGSITNYGGKISYEPEDAKKIEGNKALGRDVVGLNEENQEKLKKEIVEILKKNAQTILAKDIKIQVIL